MSNTTPVLVTGSAGRIGRAVVRELKARGHAVRGFDLVQTPGADASAVGTIKDKDEPELSETGDLGGAVRAAACPLQSRQQSEHDPPNE